jgi:hypothetical protein
VADTADFAEHVATVDGATGGTITGDVNIQSNLAVAGDINATGRATIGPGNANTALSAFVAGENDTAGGDYSSISGGRNNTASALDAAVGGGSCRRRRPHRRRRLLWQRQQRKRDDRRRLA